MEKQKVTVRVAGREYVLMSPDGEAHLNRVAAYVDRQISETAFATRMNRENVAVLVSLNMADELMKAQDENTRLRAEIARLRTGESQ